MFSQDHLLKLRYKCSQSLTLRDDAILSDIPDFRLVTSESAISPRSYTQRSRTAFIFPRVMAANATQAAGAAIVANSDKVAKVAGAVASLDAQGWTWFGLAAEGGGRRNEMSICNGTKHSIELEKNVYSLGQNKDPS